MEINKIARIFLFFTILSFLSLLFIDFLGPVKSSSLEFFSRKQGEKVLVSGTIKKFRDFGNYATFQIHDLFGKIECVSFSPNDFIYFENDETISLVGSVSVHKGKPQLVVERIDFIAWYFAVFVYWNLCRNFHWLFPRNSH